MFKVGDIVRVKADIPHNGECPNPGTIGTIYSVPDIKNYTSDFSRISVHFYYSNSVIDLLQARPNPYLGMPSITKPGYYEAKWTYRSRYLEHFNPNEKPDLTEKERLFLEEMNAKNSLSPVELYLVHNIEDSLKTLQYSIYSKEDFLV
jgi:hypothetical protein